MSEPLVVFFDIGDTLASPVIEAGQLSRLDVYPFVPEVLTSLRELGGDEVSVAVGLISNTGHLTQSAMDELLSESGLRTLVDANVCLFSSVEGLDKSQPAFFALARERADVPFENCVFVGEDAAERAVAASVGFRVSPQPLHALQLVEAGLAADPPSTVRRLT
jgi:FMN phosphatase YigB (HAD superfamily)